MVRHASAGPPPVMMLAGLLMMGCSSVSLAPTSAPTTPAPTCASTVCDPNPLYDFWLPPKNCTCDLEWELNCITVCNNQCHNPDDDVNGPWCFTDDNCAERVKNINEGDDYVYCLPGPTRAPTIFTVLPVSASPTGTPTYDKDREALLQTTQCRISIAKSIPMQAVLSGGRVILHGCRLLAVSKFTLELTGLRPDQVGLNITEDDRAPIDLLVNATSQVTVDEDVVVIDYPPRNLMGYYAVKAFRGDDNLANSSLNYGPNECNQQGEYKADARGLCIDCPTGGYCPGGRVWPEPGYWAQDEYTDPEECPGGIRACSGVRRYTGDEIPDASDGFVNTQQCEDGYTGRLCFNCDKGWYKDNAICLTCGVDEDEIAELFVVFFIFGGIFLTLSLGVTLIKTSKLVFVCGTIMLIQQLAAIGQSTSRSLSSDLDWLVKFFTYVGIFNFEIALIKPGCIVPRISYKMEMYGHMLFTAGMIVLFTLGSALHVCLIKKCDKTEILSDAEFQDGVHAMIKPKPISKAKKIKAFITHTRTFIKPKRSTFLKPKKKSKAMGEPNVSVLPPAPPPPPPPPPPAPDSPKRDFVQRTNAAKVRDAWNDEPAADTRTTGSHVRRPSFDVPGPGSDRPARLRAQEAKEKSDRERASRKSTPSQSESPHGHHGTHGTPSPEKPEQSAFGVSTSRPFLEEAYTDDDDAAAQNISRHQTRENKNDAGAGTGRKSNRKSRKSKRDRRDATRDSHKRDGSTIFPLSAPRRVQTLQFLQGDSTANLFLFRTTHSLLILGMIMHLKITQIALKGIKCTEDDGGHMRLVADPRLICYEGEHVKISVICWSTVVLYSTGFPLWCLWLLAKGFNWRCSKKRLVTKEALLATNIESYGFLNRDLEYRFRFYKLSGLVVNIVSCSVSWNTRNVYRRTFVMWSIFTFLFFILGRFSPYKKRWKNVANTFVAFFKAGWPVSLMAVLNFSSTSLNKDGNPLLNKTREDSDLTLFLVASSIMGVLILYLVTSRGMRLFRSTFKKSRQLTMHPPSAKAPKIIEMKARNNGGGGGVKVGLLDVNRMRTGAKQGQGQPMMTVETIGNQSKPAPKKAAPVLISLPAQRGVRANVKIIAQPSASQPTKEAKEAKEGLDSGAAKQLLGAGQDQGGGMIMEELEDLD